MNRYELIYLVPTKYAEDELGTVIGQIRDLVAKHGGKVTFEDNLGKKRLAYPIKKLNQCYYLLSHLDLEPTHINALERDLRLVNDVVRHLVTQRVERSRKTAPMPAVTAAPTPQTTKEEISQAKLEDLDRKLDELLAKDII